MADGAENNWVERERERGKIKKNNKERIFKWSVKKKIEFLMEVVL